MKAIELTKNEREVLVAIVANAKKVGDSGIEFFLQDVAEATDKNIRSVSATAGSLAKKGMVWNANGNSHFDGEVTEAGLHEVKSGEVKNAVDNFDAPVMDERILKLNELKSVKMANLSKGKRPAAKEAKELATYILNNWDNLAELKNIKSEDVKNEDLQNILASRLKNFEDASKAAEKAVKEAEKVKTDKNETKKAAPAKSKKDDSKKAEPKAKEEKQPKVKAPKTARKVGDVHPLHPTWVWTEYATGKFDWRTNPADKKKVGAKPETPKQPKEADTKAKSNKKVSKANTTKEASKKATPAPKKEFTLEVWKAMPKVSAKGLSKAQAEAQKLISKGFWIWNNGGHYFFKNEAGETKSCDMKTIEALFSRYGKGIPTDLIK